MGQVTILIVNKTEYDLSYHAHRCWHGKPWQSVPMEIKRNKQGTWHACNCQGSVVEPEMAAGFLIKGDENADTGLRFVVYAAKGRMFSL